MQLKNNISVEQTTMDYNYRSKFAAVRVEEQKALEVVDRYRNESDLRMVGVFFFSLRSGFIFSSQQNEEGRRQGHHQPQGTHLRSASQGDGGGGLRRPLAEGPQLRSGVQVQTGRRLRGREGKRGPAGGEDLNFMQLLADHVTVHFSETGEANKNSIVERFIRTLRGMLAKTTWALYEPNWPQLLPLIANYSETYHRTIRGKPEAVFKQESPSGQVLTRAIPDLAEGDRVRLVLKSKNRFAKGETSKLSEKTYLLRWKAGSRWVIADEETGVEKPGSYKSKDLRKEGEIWTTSQGGREGEGEGEGEDGGSQGARRGGALTAAQEEEKRKEEEEEGQLRPPKRRRGEKRAKGRGPGKRQKQKEKEKEPEESPVALPTSRPRLKEQRRQAEAAQAARTVKGQLGDFLGAGPKGDETVNPGSKRVRQLPARFRV